jgi:hypothetical protein
MRSTLQQWLDEGRFHVGAPLAWAIGAASIASVFAVVVIIVNYAPLNRESEKRIEAELPAVKYETVGALIRATGQACERVCSIGPGRSLTSATMLDVACAPQAEVNACLTPTHYFVSIEEAQTSPQR